MDLRRFPTNTNLAPGLREAESRRASVSVKQLREIGSYVKSVDPEMVSRMREDGYETNAKAVALYLLECDPDMFDDLLLGDE